MVQTFVTRIKDAEKHRIVIEKEAWEKEGLAAGDWVKVIVEKIEP